MYAVPSIILYSLIQTLQEHYDKLEKAYEELQVQFTRMKKSHIALKQRQKSSSSLISPTDERVGTKATAHPTSAPTQANVQRNVTVSLYVLYCSGAYYGAVLNLGRTLNTPLIQTLTERTSDAVH